MSPTLKQLEHAWLALDAANPPNSRKLRQWAFREIVAARIPTLDRARSELRLTPSEIESAMAWLKDAGLVTINGNEITGSMGLTTQPTRHELVLAGRKLHVWCALDAIGIPTALDLPASVSSRTGGDQRPVKLAYREGSWTPSDAFDVLVTLPEADDCINQDVCPTINFYAKGTAPSHPRASALSLDEAARLGQALWGQP